MRAPTKFKKPIKTSAKTRENSSEIFDFPEEALNQMPLFINMLIIMSLYFAIPLWWNNNSAPFAFKTGNKSIAVIALIGHYSGAIAFSKVNDKGIICFLK